MRLAELVGEEGDDAKVEAAGWGRPDRPPSLRMVRADPPTAGLHLRLRTDSRAEVESFFERAARSGGAARSAPRAWTLYRRGEYGAMVTDPEGNIIEAVTAE